MQHARALDAIGGNQRDLDHFFRDRGVAGNDWHRVVNAHFSIVKS